MLMTQALDSQLNIYNVNYKCLLDWQLNIYKCLVASRALVSFASFFLSLSVLFHTVYFRWGSMSSVAIATQTFIVLCKSCTGGHACQSLKDLTVVKTHESSWHLYLPQECFSQAYLSGFGTHTYTRSVIIGPTSAFKLCFVRLHYGWAWNTAVSWVPCNAILFATTFCMPTHLRVPVHGRGFADQPVKWEARAGGRKPAETLALPSAVRQGGSGYCAEGVLQDWNRSGRLQR